MDLEDLKRKMTKGKLKLTIYENDYEITKEHVNIIQNAKEPYGIKVYNYGTLLINSEMNEELLREGFSREFIRNIQNIRKKLNLSRFKEKIIINVKDELGIKNELGSHIESVKNETGCIEFGNKKEGEPYSFKIQEKKIDVNIEVV